MALPLRPAAGQLSAFVLTILLSYYLLSTQINSENSFKCNSESACNVSCVYEGRETVRNSRRISAETSGLVFLFCLFFLLLYHEVKVNYTSPYGIFILSTKQQKGNNRMLFYFGIIFLWTTHCHGNTNACVKLFSAGSSRFLWCAWQYVQMKETERNHKVLFARVFYSYF